jgi:hypothetical protein
VAATEQVGIAAAGQIQLAVVSRHDEPSWRTARTCGALAAHGG